MENDETLQLKDKLDYSVDDRDTHLVYYHQGNVVKDRKTLDKFLKGFYHQTKSHLISEN
jgi:hypothetical protein